MGETTDGSKALKILVGLACALLLAAAVATPSGAQRAKEGAQATGGMAKNKGKKCAASVKGKKAKKKCGKRKAPKLTYAEAVSQALDIGQIEAKRPVAVRQATRMGRSRFAVVVAFTKRPPIGTQDCSFELDVRKRHPQEFVTTWGLSECDTIKEHRDFKLRFQTGPGPKYCPSDVENSWDATVIEGRTYQEARAIAAEHGCSVRIMRQDGVDLVGTADFRYNRLNIEVEGPDLRVVRILSVA